MTDVVRSPAVAFVRAARLLRPDLTEGSAVVVDCRCPEAAWLSDLLVRSDLVDEARTANEVVRYVLDRDHDAIAGLVGLAEDLVELADGIPRCRDSQSMRFLARELDTDLLIAGLLASLRAPDPGLTNRSSLVASLEWPSVLGAESFLIDSLFRNVVVDTHVHLAGALPASFYWLAVMADFVRVDRFEGWSQDPEAWPAAVLEAQRHRKELAKLVLPGHGLVETVPRWNDGGADLPPEPFCDPVLLTLMPDPKERASHNPVLGERLLLWSCLAQVIRDPKRDVGNVETERPTRDVLTDYLRIRSTFNRHMAHHAGPRGLLRFSRSLRRHHLLLSEWTRGSGWSPERRGHAVRAAMALERFRVRHALRFQFSDPTDAPWARDQGRGLPASGPVPRTEWRPPRQIEFRITPRPDRLQARSLYSQLRGVRDFVMFDRDGPPIRVGFVFHVRRHEGETFRSDALQQVQGVLHLLNDVPSLRPFVVGIDAASQEQGIPPRDLMVAFRFVAKRTRHQACRPGVAPIRLGRTCHAGEDFKDLLTGLRYVDDAVHLLDLRPGERIGHGLALALEPTEWYVRRPASYPRRGDHLIDLLWGRHVARLRDPRCGLEQDLTLDAALEARLEELLGPRLPRERLAEVVAHYECATAEEEILEHLALDASGAARPIHVQTTSRYQQLVEALRKRVVARCSSREVIVECCPTSNMLVGNFPTYAALPYRNLMPLPAASSGPDDPPTIPFSLNSDDPGLFQTTVANEYRLLAEALIREGRPRREVVRWLDQARQTGLESTFIPPWSPPTREELLEAIDRLDGALASDIFVSSPEPTPELEPCEGCPFPSRRSAPTT